MKILKSFQKKYKRFKFWAFYSPVRSIIKENRYSKFCVVRTDTFYTIKTHFDTLEGAREFIKVLKYKDKKYFLSLQGYPKSYDL